MSSNDSIVLDGILEDMKMKSPDELSDGDVFERFAFEQILKDVALTSDQIDDGWVDGEGDGGIDGFYVIIDGYVYDGNDHFQMPKRNGAAIDLWIITAKHRTGFIEDPLASMHMTLSELFDCSKENDDLKGTYSADLLRVRSNFLKAYKILARYDPCINIHYEYASRGSSDVVADAIRGRMTQLEDLARQRFGKVTVRGEFVGARDLLSRYRKVKDENFELPFVSSLTHDDNNYVVITTLDEYYKFVTDSEGKLRRYLFDSNVRDFLGYNEVNSDINSTLKNPTEANFWWLNNGITILATTAHAQGRKLFLTSVQIVNGLQTTETLYRHFASGCCQSSEKNILIKVLTTQDEGIRARIIQATNNQSNVLSYTLHATDDVQRDIEEVLLREKFYYVRRDHYYKNEGKPQERCITPLELAKGYLSVVLKNPVAATRLRNKFMMDYSSYDNVFNSEFPIDKWPVIAAAWLSAGRIARKSFDEKLGDNLYGYSPLVVLLVVAKILGAFDYSIKQLNAISVQQVTDKVVKQAWEWVIAYAGKPNVRSSKKLRKIFVKVLSAVATNEQYAGYEQLCRRNLNSSRPKKKKRDSSISEEVVDLVQGKLPRQPWKAGVHREIANELHLPASLIYEAIDILISRGCCNNQKDGIVFDRSGKAIDLDPERCSRTLEEINRQRGIRN